MRIEMSEVKHIPADWNWKVHRSRNGRYYITAGEQDQISICSLGFAEVDKTNAQLITASPQMLEALKNLVQSRAARMGTSAVELRYKLADAAITAAIRKES
jgi:hypothetical protein